MTATMYLMMGPTTNDIVFDVENRWYSFCDLYKTDNFFDVCLYKDDSSEDDDEFFERVKSQIMSTTFKYDLADADVDDLGAEIEMFRDMDFFSVWDSLNYTTASNGDRVPLDHDTTYLREICKLEL